MIFEQLPIEVLAQILGQVRGPAPLRLWTSGSTVLRRKMVNGAVTEVDLQWQYASGRAVWPECLKHFKLTSLRIKVHVNLDFGVSSLKSELKKLHRGIKRLEIQAADAPTTFFRTADDASPSEPTSVYPPSSKRAKLQEGSDSDTQHSETWDIGSTFSELEHLFVAVAYVSRNSPAIHQDFGLSLPRTLTSLDLGSAGRSFPIVNFSLQCPPNLKYLSLPYRMLQPEELHHLPKQLERLHPDSMSENAMVALLENPQILPHLIDFPWTGHIAALSWYPIDGDYEPQIKRWPDNLRELQVSQDAEVLYNIPLGRGLTFLSFTGIRKRQWLDGNHLSHTLPASLTQLNVDNVKWKDVTAQCWPLSLTKLCIGDCQNFAPYHFHKLPRNLKFLEFESLQDEDRDEDEEEEESDDEIDTEPIPSLESLLKTGADFILQEADLWRPIKQAIINNANTASTTDPLRASILNHYVENIERGLLLGLPLSLKILKIGTFVDKVCSDYVLPPLLETLELALPKSKFCLLDYIPSTMKKMYLFTNEGGGEGLPARDPNLISNLKYLTQLHSLTWNIQGSTDAFVTSYLPRSLTTLIINAQDIDNSPETFYHLPTTLLRLWLYTSGPLPNFDKALLPPNVTMLNGKTLKREKM